MELICTSEFFKIKRYQSFTSPQGELNLNSLKNSLVKINFKLNAKSRITYYLLIILDYLLVTYIKNLTVDQLPEIKVRVSFVECLEIL